jgi:xanthine dehydrogenase accessory factor
MEPWDNIDRHTDINGHPGIIFMRELLAELTAALDQGRDCVYCCLVETRGSTPQKAGAAMLVFADGGQSGTLGGGCVEAEVKQRALRVLAAEGRPEVLTFCLDDNYGWDDGLICGGRMTIVADPLPACPELPDGRRQQARAYYGRLRDLLDGGHGCTEAVVLPGHPGSLPAADRYLFDAEGKLVAELAQGPPAEMVSRHLTDLRKRPQPHVTQGIAYLPILPRITLLIVGGGHVGQAVARLAAEVDFDVWVLDDRENYASRARFPFAQRLLVGDIGSQLEQLVCTEVTTSTYALIVTRGHQHDEEALYQLVGSAAGYVGMIGSKRKIKLIYEDLLARGISAEALGHVHAPLGFAIGSQTVPEIAVSIVAELIACRNLGATIPAARTRVKV